MLTKARSSAAPASSADTDEFPRITNSVLGTKMKIVTGYPGGNEVGLAMERGEVQGRCGWSWSSVKSTHQKWIDEKKFTILVQLALEKHAELPNVPLMIDLAKTDEQRQILRLIFARQVMGRPFVAPPNIPADRAEALRNAFMTTMKDKDFLADTEKAQMEINRSRATGTGPGEENLLHPAGDRPEGGILFAVTRTTPITNRCAAAWQAKTGQRNPPRATPPPVFAIVRLTDHRAHAIGSDHELGLDPSAIGESDHDAVALLRYACQAMAQMNGAMIEFACERIQQVGAMKGVIRSAILRRSLEPIVEFEELAGRKPQP